MTTTTTTKNASRKTPKVGNTTSGRRRTGKTVTIKQNVTASTGKKPNALKETKNTKRRAASSTAAKTLTATQLTKRITELEATVATLIKVLHNEFRSEMLQGPRGVSRSLSKAGLLKDS